MRNQVNKNVKKVIVLVLIFIVFFSFFLYMYFSPRDYEKKYTINKIDVTEKYIKEEDYYYLNLSYKDKNFEFVTQDDYKTSRGLIKNIEIVKEEDIICLIPKSNYLKTYPLCYKGDAQIDYHLVDYNFKEYTEKIDNKSKEYKDIKINYLNDKTYLIWNYNGFIYLNEEEEKKLEFLKTDNYNLDLVAMVNNYLVIPDYDNDYSFKKMYLIDIKKAKLKEWELEYEIYFDSYILGVHDKSLFIFDKKSEKEYELRPDLEKMRTIKYKTLANGEWESTTLAKLKNQIEFTYQNVYNYEVINNKLYLSYLNGENQELVSNQLIKDIISVDKETVYYLVDDKLYMFNKRYGEVLLMSYFEWNFNNQNMIYIY